MGVEGVAWERWDLHPCLAPARPRRVLFLSQNAIFWDVYPQTCDLCREQHRTLIPGQTPAWVASELWFPPSAAQTVLPRTLHHHLCPVHSVHFLPISRQIRPRDQQRSLRKRCEKGALPRACSQQGHNLDQGSRPLRLSNMKNIEPESRTQRHSRV